MLKLRVRSGLGQAAGEVEAVAVAPREVAALAAEKAAVVGAVKVTVTVKAKATARVKVAAAAAVEARVAAARPVPESARLLEEVRVRPSYLGKVVEGRSS